MSHGLPYPWEPMGARIAYRQEEARAVGMLMPWAHRVYRVTENRELAESEWTDQERAVMQAAPLGASEDQQAPKACPRLVLFEALRLPRDPLEEELPELEQRGWFTGKDPLFFYRDGHYPACGTCGEPFPCREQTLIEQAVQTLQGMERYGDPHRCPACRGVLSTAQGRETFARNLFVPAGPPVTFHTRKSCVRQLAAYRRKLSAAGYFTGQPAPQPLILCGGTVYRHEDGSQECRGGRVDCIDGIRYQHHHARECTSLSHGCPHCETYDQSTGKV